MTDCHRHTEHTWESVRTGRGLDWSRQPEVFKTYPARHHPAVPLDAVPGTGKFLTLGAGVSARRSAGGMTWYLRTNPSAGALYPCELYVQSRGSGHLADGLYHHHPLHRSLQLLCPVAAEGLEAYMAATGMVQGLVLLVSAVYYRSSWKYRDRALRYCLLDSGHLLGSLEAAAQACSLPLTIRTAIDRTALQQSMGFGQREFAVAMAVCGEQTDAAVRPLSASLPEVDATGMFEANSFIESSWQTLEARGAGRSVLPARPYPLPDDVLESAVIRRRSIREFSTGAIDAEEYAAIVKTMRHVLAMETDPVLRVHEVVHRVRGMLPGLYRDGILVEEGDFSGLCGYLCLEQVLGAAGAATLFLGARPQGPYLEQMLKAGLLCQRVYVAAAAMDIGCSGIGAFYDRETAEFLQTEELILYALAIGR